MQSLPWYGPHVPPTDRGVEIRPTCVWPSVTAPGAAGGRVHRDQVHGNAPWPSCDCVGAVEQWLTWARGVCVAAWLRAVEASRGLRESECLPDDW